MTGDSSIFYGNPFPEDLPKNAFKVTRTGDTVSIAVSDQYVSRPDDKFNKIRLLGPGQRHKEYSANTVREDLYYKIVHTDERGRNWEKNITVKQLILLLVRNEVFEGTRQVVTLNGDETDLRISNLEYKKDYTERVRTTAQQSRRIVAKARDTETLARWVNEAINDCFAKSHDLNETVSVVSQMFNGLDRGTAAKLTTHLLFDNAIAAE